MANATPVLIREEVAKSALRNGATVAAMFPQPRVPSQAWHDLVYFIEKLDNGWRITDIGSYLLEIVETRPRRWEITRSGGGTLVFEQLGDEHWRISSDSYEADLHTDGRDYVRVEMTAPPGGNRQTRTEARRLFGNSWEFTVAGPGYGLRIHPHEDDSYTVTLSAGEEGFSERLRWDEHNFPMILEEDQWEYLPGVRDEVLAAISHLRRVRELIAAAARDVPRMQELLEEADGRLPSAQELIAAAEGHLPGVRELIEANGGRSPIHYERLLTFLRGEFRPPASLHFDDLVLDPPNGLSLPGVGWLQIQPGLVTLHGQHRDVRYRIARRATFNINGLTIRDADGFWRPLGRGARHRMIRDSLIHWTYERQAGPSGFVRESPLRLAYHAVMDNDPRARRGGQVVLPEWTQWFRIEAGGPDDPDVYHQTRQCWDPDCDHKPGSTSSFRCHVCGGHDNDEDGFTDVRISLSVVEERNSRLRRPSMHSIDLPRLPLPLRLSRSFWRLGQNVAVWAPGPRPILSGMGTPRSFFPLFQQSHAGLFGVASARVGFLHRFKTRSGRIHQEMRYRFPTRRGAERWCQEGYQCLYEPIWSAKLVPLVDAVRPVEDDRFLPGSGTAHLFHSLQQTTWREVDSPEDFAWEKSRIRRDVRWRFGNFRNRRGRVLDIEHADFPDLLLH